MTVSPSSSERRPDHERTNPTGMNYSRIWRWAVLGTATVSLVPLLIMAGWNLVQFRKALAAESRVPIHNLLANAKQSVSMFLDERKSALNFIVEDNSLEQLSDPERLSRLLHNLKTSLGDVVDLGVIGSDGVQRYYVGPYNLGGRNYKDESWFREVALRGSYISDVFLGFRDFPHIVIAVRQDLGRDFFILRTTIDTQKFNAILGNLHISAADDTFLVNQEGVIQTPSRLFGGVLENLSLPLSPARNQSEVVEVTSPAGKDLLLGSVRLDGTPFTILVIKESALFLGLQQPFIGELAGFLAVSVVVILLTILRVSTIMIRRIKTADEHRIQALHEIEYTNKMATIGRLAAGVAHEINNPLAIINEKAGLLRDIYDRATDDPRREKVLKNVESIQKSVERCSKVTNRLLGFARHLEVRFEPIEPEPLIREVIGFLEKEAQYRNLALSLNAAPELPAIISDRGQLQQVFLNILNNAFAAVSDGGRIEINITRPDEDHVAVAIGDNGVGIPPEHMQRIFEPFFSTKGVKGTGLGLSITYGIVQKLGGAIEVTSRVGEGTVFTVTLPLRQE